MLLRKWGDFICCPICKAALRKRNETFYCKKCGDEYPVVDGIPVLMKLKKDRSIYEHQIQHFDKEWGNAKDKGLSEWKKTYIRRIFGLFKIRRFLKKRTASRKDAFLDVGVGASGYTVIEAAKRGCPAIGCDISLEGIRKARAYADKAGVGGNTLWIVCNAEELPFKNKKFRYICSNALLEHLPDDEKAIQEMGRVATDQSDLFITVPIKYKYLWPFFIPMNYLYDKYVGHLRRYDKSSLGKKFKNTKFYVVKDYYTGHFWKMVLFLISKILHTQAFNKQIEIIDSKLENRSYGCSNMSVYAKNYS